MTAEETEASFDLTIDLTTESEINTTASEDTAFSFKNFMAAVLNLDLFGRTLVLKQLELYLTIAQDL